MTKRLIHSFALILLATASVYAEQPIKAQIPFPFHVGESILPAGSYTVDSGGTPAVLRFRSDDTKSSVMALSNGVQSGTHAAQPKLVFNRYGDEYFLYQVWTGASDTGRQLRKSHREIEIAGSTAGGVRTVVAASR